MNEELNLCLASLLKMHFDNFQEREIYFTKNNFFGNIFRFQEMHYYFTSNFAFSFSFFFFFFCTQPVATPRFCSRGSIRRYILDKI